MFAVVLQEQIEGLVNQLRAILAGRVLLFCHERVKGGGAGAAWPPSP